MNVEELRDHDTYCFGAKVSSLGATGLEGFPLNVQASSPFLPSSVITINIVVNCILNLSVGQEFCSPTFRLRSFSVQKTNWPVLTL
jgi:hypothetical protein